MEWLVFSIYFLSAFIQGAAGFGSALVAMPLLITLVGLSMAAPMFAITGVFVALILILRYRAAFQFHNVWRIIVGTIIGIPMGVYAAKFADESIVLAILGIFTVIYGLYGLSGGTVKQTQKTSLGFLAGLAAGLLGGAYNTSGPPYVIYGDSQQWQPDEFKSNLQGLFLVGASVTSASHFVSGSMTDEILLYAILSIPFIVFGSLAGSLVDRFMDAETFRTGVLTLLIILGLTLIF